MKTLDEVIEELKQEIASQAENDGGLVTLFEIMLKAELGGDGYSEAVDWFREDGLNIFMVKHTIVLSGGHEHWSVMPAHDPFNDYQLAQELDSLPPASRAFIQDYLATPGARGRIRRAQVFVYIGTKLDQGVGITKAVENAADIYHYSPTGVWSIWDRFGD